MGGCCAECVASDAVCALVSDWIVSQFEMNKHQCAPERYFLFGNVNKSFVWMEGRERGRSPSWCDVVHEVFVLCGNWITVCPILVIGSCASYVISEVDIGYDRTYDHREIPFFSRDEENNQRDVAV